MGFGCLKFPQKSGSITEVSTDDYEAQRAVRAVVRQDMDSRGWTNAVLADAAGIDVKTVNDFIAGRRWPQRKSLRKIADALEWPSTQLDDILDGREPDAQPERPERVTDLKAWSVHDRPNIESAGEPENIFNEWAVLYSQLLPYEFRYASARGLTLGAAQDEMREILRMAQESQSGRMWAPPWKWNRPGEPWRASWWETDEGVAFREEMKSDLLRFLEEKDARERDVSAVDDNLDAAANKGDIEPEGVEFSD